MLLSLNLKICQYFVLTIVLKLFSATYTYSVKLALGSQGNDRLEYHEHLSDNSSKLYQALALATHEGINRMVMQSDLRDVYHGVHITGFHPVELKSPNGELYRGVMNDFYVQVKYYYLLCQTSTILNSNLLQL